MITVQEAIERLEEMKGKPTLITTSADEIAELIHHQQQELAAIDQGIRAEFTKGEHSGDILSDFAHFIEHHNALESQNAQLQREILYVNEHRESLRAEKTRLLGLLGLKA